MVSTKCVGIVFHDVKTYPPLIDSYDEYMLLKVGEYTRSGFVIGYFYEGYKTLYGNVDITGDVVAWASLPETQLPWEA